MEVVRDTLFVFGGRGEFSGSLEQWSGEHWVEEPLQYEHADHASATLACQ